MRQIKSHLQALLDSLEKIEETSEGQLLGGFAIIAGGSTDPLGNGNCMCSNPQNCGCDGGNENCVCTNEKNCNCSGNCKPTSPAGNGLGLTGFAF